LEDTLSFDDLDFLNKYKMKHCLISLFELLSDILMTVLWTVK